MSIPASQSGHEPPKSHAFIIAVFLTGVRPFITRAIGIDRSLLGMPDGESVSAVTIGRLSSSVPAFNIGKIIENLVIGLAIESNLLIALVAIPAGRAVGASVTGHINKSHSREFRFQVVDRVQVLGDLAGGPGIQF